MNERQEIGIDSLRPEASDVAPREVLERYLEGELAGSVKIHALGDSAAERIVSAQIEIYNSLACGSFSLPVAEALADRAAVKESKRQWRLSEYAAEYEAAYDNEEVWNAYTEANQVPARHRDGDSVAASRKKAADALLKDLLAINRARSTQT